jgi:hypothetical protein
MRITKRSFANPITTINIWIIPTFTYVLQKSLDIIKADKEWYWWLAISLALLGWLTFNFKIVKNK